MTGVDFSDVLGSFDLSGNGFVVSLDTHSLQTITLKKVIFIRMITGLTFPSYLIAFVSRFEIVDSSTSTVLPVGTVEEQLPHSIS